MRKILLILMAFIPVAVFPQLKIKVGGMVFEETNETYKVYTFDGLSAGELFDRCKNTLLSMTVDLDDMSSENKDKMIVVNGKSYGDCSYKYMGQTVLSDIDYTIRIRFKDGRMRIDAPVFQKVTSGNVLVKFEKGGLMKDGYGNAFKKNGEPRLKDLIISIENYFNNIYDGLIKGISDNTEDDW